MQTTPPFLSLNTKTVASPSTQLESASSSTPETLSFTLTTATLKYPQLLAWWFNGGSNLMPSYLYKEDAVHVHSTLKSTCETHRTLLYPAFKKWCNKYFHITHRESREASEGYSLMTYTMESTNVCPPPTTRRRDLHLYPIHRSHIPPCLLPHPVQDQREVSDEGKTACHI
jgi:hypothetical protein